MVVLLCFSKEDGDPFGVFVSLSLTHAHAHTHRWKNVLITFGSYVVLFLAAIKAGRVRSIPTGTPTLGAMDLGGASTQVAFLLLFRSLSSFFCFSFRFACFRSPLLSLFALIDRLCDFFFVCSFVRVFAAHLHARRWPNDRRS